MTLSPYISESIRQREREAEQRRALERTLDELGISEKTSRMHRRAAEALGLTLREHLAQIKRESALRAERARTQQTWLSPEDRESSYRARRRAQIAGARADLVSRASIIERDGPTCYLCGAENLTPAGIHIDHVIPLSRGGAHSADNLRVACVRCNLTKGGMTAAEYRAIITT